MKIYTQIGGRAVFRTRIGFLHWLYPWTASAGAYPPFPSGSDESRNRGGKDRVTPVWELK
jgi:hypothetical protein